MKENSQDQISSIDSLMLLELRMLTLQETKNLHLSDVKNRLEISELTSKWKRIVPHAKVPTPHYDPLHDLLLLYALGRAGARKEEKQMYDSMESDFATKLSQSEDKKSLKILQHLSKAIFLINKGEYHPAYSHMEPICSLKGEGVVRVGGSYEQREVINELYMLLLVLLRKPKELLEILDSKISKRGAVAYYQALEERLKNNSKL